MNRFLLVFTLLTLSARTLPAKGGDTFENPVTVSKSNPDPFVLKHTDGFYYGLSTHEKHTDITLFRDTDLLNLYRTEPKVIWKAPKTGWNTHDIWAPEIHFIQGEFYIYYSGGDGKRQSTGVLKCSGKDPFSDSWSDAGRLYSPEADDWAIDGTVLEQNGNLYFIWSGETPDNMKIQKLFISKMNGPTALTGPRVEICRPTLPFERRGNPKIIEDVNEGPEILKHENKTFLVYSCSFCGTRHYNLNMLTCSGTADPMVPSNWTKSQTSIFSEKNGLYGTGHCSFTKSPNGKEDWLVFHAMLDEKDDQPRYVCMQPFAWNADGSPNFGAPQKSGIQIPR
jgi:GH43 family beta-xylosidase